MSDFIVKVVRFSPLYPEQDPDSYVVGFHVVCKKNMRSTYKEKRIYFKEARFLGVNTSEEKMIEFAWDKTRDSLKNWRKEVLQKDKMKGFLLENPL